MKKLLLFLFLVAGLSVPASLAAPNIQIIYVVNSSSLSDATVQDAIPAFQAAIDNDFGPSWNAYANLVFVDKKDVPRDGWEIIIDDHTDVLGAAGYHEIGINGKPWALVGVFEGANWQLVFTHELFELLADPYINRLAHGDFYDETFYILEVADPVESQKWSYTRPGASGVPVVISDFVTENWYSWVDQKGVQYDFTRHIHHPHRILYGGYAYIYKNGAWESLPSRQIHHGCNELKYNKTSLFKTC